MWFSWDFRGRFRGFSMDFHGMFVGFFRKCTNQWFTSIGVSELDIDLPWKSNPARARFKVGGISWNLMTIHVLIKYWLENQLDDDVQIFAQKKNGFKKTSRFKHSMINKKNWDSLELPRLFFYKKCREISHPSIEDTWDNLVFVAAGGIFAEAKSGVARGTWVSWVVLVLSLEHDRKIRPKMGAKDLWEGRTHTIGGVLAVQERCVCWVFLCLFNMAWTWNALTLCNLCQMLYICIQITVSMQVLCIFVSMISNVSIDAWCMCICTCQQLIFHSCHCNSGTEWENGPRRLEGQRRRWG